jgi:hypothetical protein
MRLRKEAQGPPPGVGREKLIRQLRYPLIHTHENV